MPFKSKKQEKWAFANKMPWAKKWAGLTKGTLPAKVKKAKKVTKKVAKKKKS